MRRHFAAARKQHFLPGCWTIAMISRRIASRFYLNNSARLEPGTSPTQFCDWGSLSGEPARPGFAHPQALERLGMSKAAVNALPQDSD